MKTDATLVNLRHDDDTAIFAALHLPRPETDAETDADKEHLLALTVGEDVDAWYPVIDKTRCAECGRCHDFCLFNVYELKNSHVHVARPQSCKHNCPACARMCPSQAIIFPKYEKSPINGGLTDEETFNPSEKDKLYHERLRMRLEQRKKGIPLTQNDNK
jgi:MinD superfamily P-loop ATPase